MLRQLARSGAQFAISTGDDPYGATGVTIESKYGDLFTAGNGLSAVFGPLFWPGPGQSLPLFPTLGNHGMASEFLKNWPRTYAAAQSGGVFVDGLVQQRLQRRPHEASPARGTPLTSARHGSTC